MVIHGGHNIQDQETVINVIKHYHIVQHFFFSELVMMLIVISMSMLSYTNKDRVYMTQTYINKYNVSLIYGTTYEVCICI